MVRFPPYAIFLCAALLIVGLSGCGRPAQHTAAGNSSAPRVEEFASGPILATFSFTPPAVRLDHETLLLIRVSSPTNITVRLPSIEGRMQGFNAAGVYDRQPETRNGCTIQERHVRLTPQMAPRYRIAPMAIIWTRAGDPREQWFPTRPVILDSEALVKGHPDAMAGPKPPFWIPPDPLTLLAYAGAAVAGFGLLYLAWQLVRKWHRATILKRMSPRQRALFELAELLDRGLIAKNHVKEFYFELTMIVRCYIERAHTIRAPEQTTEEFLTAVSHDTRFSPGVVKELRAFLNAADLVKYAAFRPDRETVNNAIATAKTYIETDSDESPAIANGQSTSSRQPPILNASPFNSKAMKPER